MHFLLCIISSIVVRRTGPVFISRIRREPDTIYQQTTPRGRCRSNEEVRSHIRFLGIQSIANATQCRPIVLQDEKTCIAGRSRPTDIANAEGGNRSHAGRKVRNLFTRHLVCRGEVNYTSLLILASPCRYFQSIMPIHWLATYREPLFRELAFVKDRQLRYKQQKVIQEGLLTMLEDIDVDADMNSTASDHVCTITTEVIDVISLIQSDVCLSPSKRRKNNEECVDPFADLRSELPPTNCKTSKKASLITVMAEYKLMSSVNGSRRPCPFEFWRAHAAKFPNLATIANRILVI